MRFDLELNIVSKLTQDGLDNLSESLYGISNITSIYWDEASSIDKINLNKGTINKSGYNSKRNIDDSHLTSGVDMLTDDLKFVQNIVYGSTVIPVFNSGKYTVNKGRYFWSKNNIVKPCVIKDGRYTCEIKELINPSDIIISTISFVSPGYNKVKRQFIYVPWDQLYYEAGPDPSDPKQQTMEDTFKYIFKNNLADYKFTIYNNTVYLSVGKISYNDIPIGRFQDTKNKMFVLPEFPISNLKINGFTEGTDYTVKSSIVTFNKDASVVIGAQVVASFDVTPFVSYLDNRGDVNDFVFFNTNMHPKTINYKNGTLCISNSFGGASIPLKLTSSTNKNTVFFQEPFRATARLTGVGDTAITDKNVTLEILTNNAVFTENNSHTITKPTLADGTIQCEVAAKTDAIGYYIQKEWVSGNTLTLPFELKDVNTNSTYLYFITSDDPILGKKFKSPYDEKFSESYVTNDIGSYSMNGRKIAYVSLQDNNGKLTSRFIKPVSSETAVSRSVNYRNLFCDTRNSSNTTFKSVMDLNGVVNTSLGTISTSGEYALGVLPGDKLDLYSYTAPIVTDIVFEKSIPASSNIAGYWLITDSVINIKASFEDDNISLESNTTSVDLQNIKSETSFVLNRENTSLGASQLGVFGYLSISEYLKNQYGLNAFSLYCTHSDCIFKKCIHPDPSIRTNFVLDEGKVGCAHNKEWDDENWVCPGQNAHLMNPFIMHLEVI